MTTGTLSNSVADSINQPSLTAFGEMQIAPLIGTIQGQFPYNVNSELITDTSSGSGSLSVSTGLLSLSSGAATSSSAQILTKRVIEYHPGTGVNVRFTTIFDTSVDGNEQIIGVGNDDNGFFFGYSGTSFGVTRRRDGTDNFIPQNTWNKDKFDGTGASGQILDTSKGNVYQIQYQWLGFGAIKFFIENSNTGLFQLCHEIKYANSNIETSITNPTLPFCAQSVNTTNDTDVVLKTGSFGVYQEGFLTEASFLVHGENNLKAVTTETNIITIKNRTTFASVPNQVRVRPVILTLGTEGNKPVLGNIILNTTLGGTPSFTDFSTNTSVVSIDTAGTTVTGGIQIMSFSLGRSSTQIVDLKSYPIFMNPGDTITITGKSSLSNEIAVGITWEERFT